MDENEQTIVINDLLSFFSCKIKIFQKEKIISCLSQFYSQNAIIEAEKTLIASLSDGETSKYLKGKREKDPTNNLFKIFEKVPESELPIFVCKNLNNVPKLENEEVTNDDEEIDENVDDLVNEQKFIKNQIAEISSVVYQLKDQIQLLAKHRMKNKGSSNDTSHSKENGISFNKNKDIYRNIATKSNGIAHLQNLIDEEEEEKKCKLIPEESYTSFEEDNEEAENLIQLIANRQQRALAKNVEAEVLSVNTRKSNKRSRVSLKRKLEQPTTSSVSNKMINSSSEELLSDVDEEEIELHLDDFEGKEDYEDDSEITIIKKRKIKPNHIIIEEVDDENVGKLMLYKCSLCNFSTNDESTINRHECPQIHGGSHVPDDIKTFKYFCLECKFRSNNRALHQRHLERHPQYFSCPFCEEKYEDPEDWTEHALQCIRNGDRKQEDHICPVCNVIYATPSAIRLHRGNHDLNRQFECLVCRFRFRTEEQLEAHMRIHSARGFKCPFCTYIHKNKYTFMTHVRSHTGETPFVCELCEYKCSSSSAITAHMFCHSSIRDKRCDECPAIFKTTQKLNAHKKIHRKGHDFKCPVCKECFASAWLMTVHHNGVHMDPQSKVLPCPLCDFTSVDKNDFRRHIQMHERNITFVCSLCNYSAYEKGMLDAHMKQDHLLMEV